MIGRSRVLVELVLACVALAGACLSWSRAHHVVAVAPIAEGQPSTQSLVYDPQLLLVSLVLLTVAGISAAVGFARLLRARTRYAGRVSSGVTS